MKPFDFDRYGSAFVDMRLHRLRALITDQCDEVFHANGVEASSASASLVLLLLECGRANTTQIADALGYSHQLIAHRLKQLEALGHLQKFVDARDRRKWIVKLTPRGRAEAKKIAQILPVIAKQFDGMFFRVGVELNSTLQTLHRELLDEPLIERMPGNENRKRA